MHASLLLSRRIRLLLLLLGLVACTQARAVEAPELKAAIVFNLLLFVEWPAEALPASADSMVLCINATSPLGAPLRALQGRMVRSLRLDVRELPAQAPWVACHAVFMDADDGRGAAPKPTTNIGTLLISDDTSAPPAAAIIVLRRAGARIAFDVNLTAAKQARLQFSSKLLRLAHTVTE